MTKRKLKSLLIIICTNVDFLIYKKNHVLYKNFNREIEIEILNKIINQESMSQKQVSKEKDSLINNHPEVQPEEIKKVLNEKRKKL